MKHEFDIITENMSFSIEEIILEEGLYEYDFEVIRSEESERLSPTQISWLSTVDNFIGSWSPGTSIKKNHRHEYEKPFVSKGTHLMPLIQYFSKNNLNALTVTCSELIESVVLDAELNERTGGIKTVIRLFEEYQPKDLSYHLKIRMDYRKKRFNETLKDMMNWYDQLLDIAPLAVPISAVEPVYSTWYSFHQMINSSDVRRQCERAKKLGMNTLILDDGWQTDDISRSYAFTGDWIINTKKMKNMKSHVETIQGLGMNYMMWLSVPYVGEQSKIWHQLKDNTLYYQPDHDAYILDLRYPQVRNYLIDTFVNLYKNYNLNGLKLDFIDRFKHGSIDVDPNMDMESVQKSVDVFLTDLKNRLIDIDPNCLIEFRQNYIGPRMRRLGNMFRVHDCAYDSVINRVGIVDLRMTSQETAVHSDMIMWHEKDAVENAALQIINVLHGIPQISMRLDTLSATHTTMLTFYLKFWHTYKHVLLGEMIPYAPELNYPRIDLIHDEQMIVILSETTVINWPVHIRELILINGTMKEEVIVTSATPIWGSFITHNVLGEVIEKQSICQANLLSIKMPISGVVTMTTGGSSKNM